MLEDNNSKASNFLLFPRFPGKWPTVYKNRKTLISAHRILEMGDIYRLENLKNVCYIHSRGTRLKDGPTRVRIPQWEGAICLITISERSLQTSLNGPTGVRELRNGSKPEHLELVSTARKCLQYPHMVRWMPDRQFLWDLTQKLTAILDPGQGIAPNELPTVKL